MRPRTAVAALVLVACAVGAPLLGVAAANAARPVIPPASPTSSGAPEFEAMPAAPSTALDVSSALESLPVVDPGADPNAPRHVRSLTLTDAELTLTATLDLAEISGNVAVPIEYRKGRPRRVYGNDDDKNDSNRNQLTNEVEP